MAVNKPAILLLLFILFKISVFNRIDKEGLLIKKKRWSSMLSKALMDPCHVASPVWRNVGGFVLGCLLHVCGVEV